MKAVAVKNIDSALAEIRAIVGPKGWTDDAEEMAPYLVDARERYRGTTPMLVRPANAEQVAAVVATCARYGVGLVPQGGNTGLCGGAVPARNEILLNLSRMNRIRVIDGANYTMTAEAGCVLADLQRAAAEADRLFPLSLAAEGSCELGGNLATNAGGRNVLRYGMARDLVLGLEVALPDGRLWNGLRGLRKDNTGYDLKQLFIGSEGSLGVITAAVVKLFPLPRERRTGFLAMAGIDETLTLLSRARLVSDDKVTAFEYLSRPALALVLKHVPGLRDPLDRPYDHYALIELSSGAPGEGLGEMTEALLARAIEDGLVLDGVIATSEAQAEALWKIRESCSEAQKSEGGSIKHDVSVPVSRVPEFIRRACAAVEREIPGARPAPFGHVGDGNIHFNVSQPVGADRAAFLDQWPRVNRLVHDLVHEMGGSFSAEHGIGRLKRDDLVRYKPAIEVELMRRIKDAIDPRGIMNPGKVV